MAGRACKRACARQEPRSAPRRQPAMQSEELREALAGHLEAVGGGAAVRSDELRAALAGHLDAAADGFPMRSGGLRDALLAHLEAVSVYLQSEIAGGAEVPFELERHGRPGRGGRPALYCYQPLTYEFMTAREGVLQALPSHRAALLALEDFDGLERYLLSAGIDVASTAGGARARAALRALTEEVFAEQSDFDLRPARVAAALSRMESALGAAPCEVTLLASLHGMAIA